jgi:anti-sigma factor RsiW
MNEGRFRELLAEYVAGELDDRQAAAFRAELEANPQRRKLAQELQAAAAALETNVLSETEAEHRVASLRLEGAGLGTASERPAHPGHRRHARWRASLRYAAVILLAFSTGFLVRGWLPGERGAMAKTSPTPAINERYLANFLQVTQSFPESSAFSRSLLALARR